MKSLGSRLILALLVPFATMAIAESVIAEDAYKLREAAEYIKNRDGAEIPHVATSDHFALKWGSANNKNYPITDAYVQSALNYFERIRTVYSSLGFPCIKSEAGKFKNNIYITETGLKPFLSGYAFGFADTEGYGVFIGEPSIITPGHNGAAHEFAHATQGESGGFRDSDYVGWFWECHAQFMGQQVNDNNLPENMELYLDTAQFELSSTRHHYGSWLFPQYLAERPDFGYKFVSELWFKPAVNPDEDPIAKICRLAGFTDVPKQWADLYGDYAKRNVTFNSYKRGKAFLASIEKVPERYLSRSKAVLEELPGATKGWYRVPYIFAPQQNAYNIVPLTPDSRNVSVTFKGIIDEARGSDWRTTLVIVNDKGEERFSNTFNSGTKSIQLAPNENKLYLVVAATPHVYKPTKFTPDYRTLDRFPYEVKIEGATPRGIDPAKLPWPKDTNGSAHANGGGFVADTAKVAASAYVGPNARVLDQATVSDNARIEDYAVISGQAKISGNAIVSGHALVTDQASVAGFARIRDYARLYDKTSVDGNARVIEFPRLHRNTRISGDALIKAFAIVNGSQISGSAIMECGADPGGGVNAAKGLYSWFVGQQDCDKAHDNKGLLASYGFNTPHSFLLKDDFSWNDGFVYGNPSKLTDTARGGVIRFNGKDQYVELPKFLSDLRGMELSIWVKWNGGPVEQRIFDFGRDNDNCMYLTPKGKDGKLALILRTNGKYEFVKAHDMLPVGKWTQIIVKLNAGTGTIEIDGKKVAESTSLTITPEDIRAEHNYLAKAQAPTGFLNGQLDDLTISRAIAQ